jgi:hypothetical protein
VTAPFVLIAALGLLFFAGLAAHPSWVLSADYSDMLAYQLPQMRFLVSSWRQTGELPLWCPYSFAGMPFVHDLQVAAFYPPHLVLYLLPEAMVGPALSWLIVAHVTMAGWATFAYGRSQGLSHNCAVIAALGYMFAGKWLLHLLVGGQYVVVGLAWLPLVLLFLERGIQRGGLLEATWAGVVLALLVLGSHPQLAFYAVLLIALWTLPAGLERTAAPDQAGLARRRIIAGMSLWAFALAWCGMVAGALVAVQLLPTLEAAAHTTRAAAGVEINARTDLVLPFFGLVGPPPEGVPTMMRWEYRTGWTVLWVATALIAPALLRGPGRTRYQAAVCLGLVVFGMGGAVAFQGLPGFLLFQIPSRMFLLAALPVALLAGASTQALSEQLPLQPRVRGSLVRVMIGVLAVGLVTTAFLAWAGGRAPGVSVWAYWGSLCFTLPMAWWLLARSSSAAGRAPRWAGPRFPLAWGALLLADLWAMEWPLVSVRPEGPVYAPSACVQLVRARRHDHERVLDRAVPGELGSTPLAGALAIMYRLDPIGGYNPLDIHRYKEYVQFISDRDEPIRPDNRIGNFPIVNKSLLDLLGARYLLQPSGMEATAPELGDVEHDRRWQPIGGDRAPEAHVFVPGGLKRLPPYTVYENREAFPRAFVVPRAEPLPRRAGVLAALKTADLRSIVFLEGFEQQPASGSGMGELAPARIVSYEPNHVTVEVDCAAPGYLVLTDPWYPGWMATVDGRAAPLYRADYAFRAVAVGAGQHQVRFRFQPESLKRGKMISLAALAGVCGLSVLMFARRIWRRGRGSALAGALQTNQTRAGSSNE